MSNDPKDLRSDGTPNEFWFNTKTGEVEVGKLSAAPYRVGPFRTEADAKNAPALLAERARTWRSEDALDD